MTTPFRTPAIVEVEWLDSMAFPGWRDGNDVVERTDCVDDMRHRTCGYLVKKTQQYVAVGLSIGWTGTVGDAIQIPRAAVRSMTVLRERTYAAPRHR